MDCPKFIVSNKKEEFISIQRVKCCAMDFFSHQGTTLILIERSGVQLVCLFDVYLLGPFHLITKKNCYLI